MYYKFGHDENGDFVKEMELDENIVPEEEKNYDAIVVGCGSSGIPCAVRLHELGVKVAVVQKESTPSCCGNFTAGIDLSKSDKESLAKVTELLQEENDYKPKAEVINIWRDNSGEALKWILKKGEEAGANVKDLGPGPQTGFVKGNDLDVEFMTPYFGPKPYNVQDGLSAILDAAVKDGLEVFYDTPAVKLVTRGKDVVGVLCKQGDKYIQFNGTVVLTTGDYQNDKDMVAHYLPQMSKYETKKSGRTGDGQKMIMAVGGSMEMIGHTKMVHDMDAEPFEIMDLPYMRVKLNGERFVNEEIHMEYMNNFLLDDGGYYCEIFDGDVEATSEKLGQKVTKDTLKNFMPEVPGEKEGVVEDQTATYSADTLEELAEKLGIQDVETFKKTVERYNELLEKGVDEDFGVKSEHLFPIKRAPFYGVKRHVRLTMACSGVSVDGRSRVVDLEGNPIKGLYATGNLAGNFYGAHDYPLTIVGLNLGRNITNGYQVANEIAETGKEK